MDYILQLVPSSGGVYKTIYEPGTSDIEDLEFHFEVNEPGYCEFCIYPSHVLFDSITLEECYLRLRCNLETLAIYRVAEIKKDLWGRKYVYALGDMALLADSYLNPYNAVGSAKTPMAAFNNAVSWHNTLQTDKYFSAIIKASRNKTYFDNFQYSWYFDNLLDWIKTNIVDEFGGFLAVTYITLDGQDHRRIVWMDETDADSNNTQTITVGVNLLEAQESNIITDLATQIIPLGTSLDVEEYDPTKTYQPYDFCWHTESNVSNIYQAQDIITGPWDSTKWAYIQKYYEGTENKFTIMGEPNQQIGNLMKVGNMIYSPTIVNRYGLRWKSVDFGNIDRGYILVPEAVAYYNNMIASKTIELKAFDLSMTSDEFARFKWLNNVHVSIPELEIETDMFISEQTIYPQNPESNTITLGKTINTLTQQMRKKK